MMAGLEDWEFEDNLAKISREKTLKHVDTVEVKHIDFDRASTKAIASTIKSTEDVVQEMRTWLRSGVAPDGTRMMTEEAWQWYNDYYQCAARSDADHMCLPKDALVDYYYWSAPYLAHIGEMNLVMMHSQVNLPDGTHLPADRLRTSSMKLKNLEIKARKRLDVMIREDREFVAQAMDPGAHRGHPLRKEGIYTKYIWRPFIRQETNASINEPHAAMPEEDEAAIPSK